MLFKKSLKTFIFVFLKEEYFKNDGTLCCSCLVYCSAIFILFWFSPEPVERGLQMLTSPQPTGVCTGRTPY